MQHLKDANKIHNKQTFTSLVFFFQSDKAVCNNLNVNFIETTLQTIFFPQKRRFFAFLTKKL